MKNISFIFLFLLFSNQVSSQKLISLKDDNRVADSLKTVLFHTKSDSVKCILSFKLAHIYAIENNPELRKTYLSKAIGLIHNSVYLKDLLHYYTSFDFYMSKDFVGYKKALEVANEKLKKYNSQEIYFIRGVILFNLSMCFQREGNVVEAIKILTTKAIPIAEKTKNSLELAKIYRFLGVIFYNNNNLEKAAYYLKLSIQKLEEKRSKSVAYNEKLVQVYLFYSEILTAQKKLNEASLFLNKAIKALKMNPDSNLYIDYYLAKGSFEHQNKNYKEALIVFDKGISSALLSEDFMAVNRLKLLKFGTLKIMKRFGEAKNLLMETFKSDYLPIEDKINYTKELAFLCKGLKDFSNSVKYYEQYIQLNDSIVQTRTKNEIIAIEAKFNKSENEKKIAKLEAQNKEAALSKENNKLYYILLSMLSFILLSIIFFLWKNAKNQHQLTIEKDKNYNQNLSFLKTQKEIEVMQAMISGEELERKRIARDLHDGIGSRLSAMKMRLQEKPATATESQIKEIEIFKNLLNNSIVELRQVAFNLLPETLLKLGLEFALRDLCNSLKTKKVIVEFHASGISKTISESNQITIFRIVQELLNNALKHSQCSEIIVDCSQNKKLFLITVEDNGIGFDAEKALNVTGLGFKNIKNRVDLLNGKLEIRTSSNKGAIFNIELCI